MSFYPIDPRGLPVFDTDINQALPLTADHAVLQGRQDSLRVLASNTDGIAFLNSNDLRGQMRRLAADFTSYYLLGYSSTNAKLDGGFRTIKVTRVASGRRSPGAARLSCRERLGARGGEKDRRHAKARGQCRVGQGAGDAGP